MATYKVIQDIEAEDKFVGPLTLKQFVFAAVGVVFSYLCFFVAVRGVWFVAIPFAPVALFGFFMAIPWSKDQPTDVWVLAKIRFRFKPKIRMWDQTGKQELVTITAPKVEEKILTKDISETEVESRLRALADTMNTRGWAVKHVNQPNFHKTDPSSSRLTPTPIPVGSRAALDENTPDRLENTRVDTLIDESTKTRKANLHNALEQARQGQPKVTTQTVTPSDEAESLSAELKQRKKAASLSTGKMQKLQTKPPEDNKTEAKQPAEPTEKTERKTESEKSISNVTEPSRPGIINLAHNNDLDVATLARQANKDSDESQEVVVSLH